MCGIVGVFARDNAYNLVLDSMMAISYRGRDGYGIYDGKNVHYSNFMDFKLINSNFAIGHCLHAVVSNVKQPFIGNGVLAVNCEIYNWKELSDGYGINARNDAELFFNLLERFGVEKTLGLLDGDYAGVYFRDRKVFLFRDRVGVKPIWYSTDSGFAFSSERKSLREIGFKDIVELNPRELLVYDTEVGKVNIINLDFYDFFNSGEDYAKLKNKLGGYLVNAVAKRVPEVKFGLLFSGAVDSSLIALVLKRLNLDFKCYTCVVKDIGEAIDLKFSRIVAGKLDLDLEIIEVSLDEIDKALPIVCKLIESNDVTKVSVALAFYFACKKARDDGCKVILSGLGADDLFGGYERHLKSGDVNKECYNSLLNIYERDLYRDDVITMHNNIELRVPYLDRKLISFALGIDGKFKINENGNKYILRDLAVGYGLDKEFSFRKKKAVQYGGNFLKALEKLSKKNGFETKSNYLSSLYNEGNVKLVALFSSGKDSCYAMYVMKKRNYDVRCLVTIDSKNKDSFMYHTPNVHMVKLQAEALGLPLIMEESSGEKEKELEDLERALIKAKKEYNVGGVVVGAIFSTYQRDRVQRIADKLGLKVFLPLWHKNQEVLLKELLENKFEIIISSVAADGLNESWLGKKLDENMIADLINLNKKNGINIAFEGGEAETLVLDCPMFKKKLIIEDAEAIMDSKYSGIFNVKKAKLANKSK